MEEQDLIRLEQLAEIGCEAPEELTYEEIRELSKLYLCKHHMIH